jgi:hypothetical protein
MPSPEKEAECGPPFPHIEPPRRTLPGSGSRPPREEQTRKFETFVHRKASLKFMQSLSWAKYPRQHEAIAVSIKIHVSSLGVRILAVRSCGPAHLTPHPLLHVTSLFENYIYYMPNNLFGRCGSPHSNASVLFLPVCR